MRELFQAIEVGIGILTDVLLTRVISQIIFITPVLVFEALSLAARLLHALLYRLRSGSVGHASFRKLLFWIAIRLIRDRSHTEAVILWLGGSFDYSLQCLLRMLLLKVSLTVVRSRERLATTWKVTSEGALSMNGIDVTLEILV